ncbi:GL27367 [Drosophila persimilis]|uniref:GL27367 n=1 Tax=Drosophila persimilis TaxID=7234 RepID=B4HC97_DROPE|nr:GL27367 [Drosophila persimilis]
MVKGRLVLDPVLACANFSKKFILQTDASDYGLGSLLPQKTERGERVISYASRTLTGPERNYLATEKECLAIVWAIRQLRSYLEGYRFKAVTDHMALKWLNSIESPSGRVARWALELQQYVFEVAYRKGQLNVVADAPDSCRIAKEEEVHPMNESPCNWVEGMKDKLGGGGCQARSEASPL